LKQIAGPSIAEGTQAYAKLRAQVRAAGILDKSYAFYAPLVVASFLGYALSVWAVYALDNYLFLAVACLGFTFFSVQLGGLMHDAGHRAIFSSNTLNDVMGVACSVLMAMVFDNWRTRHNAHHAFSNQKGKDPDLEIPLIATSDVLRAAKGPLEHFVTRYQAYYFYPLGAVVSFSNRLGSLSYFIHRRSLGDLARFVGYVPPLVVLFVLPFVLFSPEKAAFVFLLVHITSGIYLANCFAPNHKGMPTLGPITGMSFIEQQVITSRNVKGGFVTDILLVGLNHQVEHHLFPTCPRNKLRLIKPLLEETCRDLGLRYLETGVIETNRDILRHLRAAVRRPRIADATQLS
jgi:fatty acid desaturase